MPKLCYFNYLLPMKTWCVLFILLLALPPNSTANTMDAKALASAVAKFSAKFCNELEKGKSVVSSPLSAEFVLALLTLGSTDPAHSELLISLGVPDDDCIRTSFSNVSSKLRSLKGVTLNVANKVYIQQGSYDLVPELKEDAIKVFDADFEKVEFSDGAAAAALINEWVESKTNNRIKELLSADSLNSDTRLVLVNAIYFKGTWQKQFDPAHTIEQPFHLNIETTVNVPMMYREDNYRYGDSTDLQAQLLELPYEGGETSMVVILPHEIEGLEGVLSKLADGYDLISELDKMFKVKVKVSLPKFKIETEIDLTEVLPKLGIKAIFDRGDSGLTKILTPSEPLYVSKGVQKAFIEVNEEGAEAAAATVGGVRRQRSAEWTRVFAADRPSLWCIRLRGYPVMLATYRPHARASLFRDEL